MNILYFRNTDSSCSFLCACTNTYEYLHSVTTTTFFRMDFYICTKQACAQKGYPDNTVQSAYQTKTCKWSRGLKSAMVISNVPGGSGEGVLAGTGALIMDKSSISRPPVCSKILCSSWFVLVM